MDRVAIVFPIRFATHETAVQTTARELSLEGVLVTCLEPPPQGTPVAMRLYLPGSREGLPAEGVDLVGPLPSDYQYYVNFAAGIGTKAKHVAEGKALIQFLASPATTSTLASKGMEAPKAH